MLCAPYLGDRRVCVALLNADWLLTADDVGISEFLTGVCCLGVAWLDALDDDVTQDDGRGSLSEVLTGDPLDIPCPLANCKESREI